MNNKITSNFLQDPKADDAKLNEGRARVDQTEEQDTENEASTYTCNT